MARTTLELDSEVRKRLKAFKFVRKESYDELLTRMMDQLEKTDFAREESMTIEDEAEKILRLLGAKAKDKAKDVWNDWKVKSLVEQALSDKQSIRSLCKGKVEKAISRSLCGA